MLHKLQSLFVKLVDRIEGHSAPPGRYFLLFLAILSVRLALEFFSSHRLFTFHDILHIGLWFAFIVLAFMLQLQLFSGVPMAKVARLVVVGFTIALTAPIIDIVVHGGVGAKMNYLSINSLSQILPAYFTIGGASLSRGATLGIRIEIVLLVIASFNYVRTKTGSILKGILGAWCIYTVLFLSGTIPKLLGWLVAAMDLTYQPDDQSTVLLLLVLDAALLFFIFLRHSPRWMGLILKHVPWGTLTIGALNFLIGVGLAGHAYPSMWELNPTTLFWFPLLAGVGLCLGATAGVQRFHNQSETDSDPPKKVRQTQQGLLLVTFLLSLAISERVLFPVMVIWGLMFLLNEAPLNLGRTPLLRTVMEAMALFAAALAGFGAMGGPMVGFPVEWMLPLLVFPAVAGLFADVGRPRTVILWYHEWSHHAQMYFQVGCMMALVAAIACTAFFLFAHTAMVVVLLVLSIPPIVVINIRSTRTQLILIALAPIYALLAYAAWGWIP